MEVSKIILDTVTRTSIERRIKLSTGDKINGEVDIMSSYLCFSVFTGIEGKGERPTLPGDWCFVRILRLADQQQERGRKVVYESTFPSRVSFEAPEDGEYLIEIKLREWIEEVCVRIRLYLEEHS